MKSNKGITLIVLIITIIVMLILSIVSIKIVSDSGMLKKTEKATDETKIDIINEQISQAAVMAIKNGKITKNNLENEIRKIYANETVEIKITEEDLYLIVQIGEKTYKVNTTTGKVEYLGLASDVTINWNKDRVTVYTDSNNVQVPIPKGYTVSNIDGETTVAGGLVIYQGSIGTTSNQFVWIPINNPSEMYGTDINGNKLGKLYNFDASGNMTPLRWTETNGVMSWSEWVDAESHINSWREPAYLANSDKDSMIITQNLLQTEFNNMIASIHKYNGFYVGRYETRRI